MASVVDSNFSRSFFAVVALLLHVVVFVVSGDARSVAFFVDQWSVVSKETHDQEVGDVQEVGMCKGG